MGLTVCVVGPQRANGFGHHCQQICQALSSCGDTPIFVPVGDTLPICQAIIFMGWFQATPTEDNSGDGGDPLRHWKVARELAHEANVREVPLIINANWDDNPRREVWLKWAISAIEQISSKVFWASWAPGFLTAQGLQGYHHRLVSVMQPTPLAPRATPSRSLPWDKREAICIGEAGKLGRKRYTGAFSVPKCIDLIHERLGDVLIRGYNQYKASWSHDQVKFVKTRSTTKFHEWLSGFRVFVSLTRFETFSRVPAEAQALGVPVVYRPMPQSLNARIGMAGIPACTEAEVADAVAYLYRDQEAWETFHTAGLAMAQAHDLKLVGLHWHHLLTRLKSQIRKQQP